MIRLASFFNPARVALLTLTIIAVNAIVAADPPPTKDGGLQGVKRRTPGEERRRARAVPAPIVLEPGKVIRIKISTDTTQAPSSGSIVLRIELESPSTGGGGGVSPPPAPPPSTDTLTKELVELYEKDTGQDKAKHAAALGQLYRWAAKLLRAQGGTAGGFRKALGAQSAQLLPTDVLLPLRQRVQTELRAVLPSTASTTLDEATRTKAADLFDKLGGIMEGISK